LKSSVVLSDTGTIVK